MVVADGRRRAGRPRDVHLDRELISAAQHLLAEVGYDKLSMEAVAARTGSGKTTVYRRWKTKADLVVDAIRALEWAAEAPDTGSLRGDLIALAGVFLERNTLRDSVMAGMVTAMARDGDIRRAVAEIVDAPRHDAFAAILANAYARGEIVRPDGWEFVRDIFPAMAFHRVAVLGLPLDEEFTLGLIDEITVPLLTRSDRVRPSTH